MTESGTSSMSSYQKRHSKEEFSMSDKISRKNINEFI